MADNILFVIEEFKHIDSLAISKFFPKFDKKGLSFIDMPLHKLISLMHDEIEEFNKFLPLNEPWNNSDLADGKKELLDIMNFCRMIYYRIDISGL